MKPETCSAIGKLEFGTLVEINHQTAGDLPSRVDMVLRPLSPDYFTLIQTSLNQHEQLVLVPNGIGTAYPKYIASILEEKISFREMLKAYERGLEIYSPKLQLHLSTIRNFWRYSKLPSVEVKYNNIPEEVFDPNTLNNLNNIT